MKAIRWLASGAAIGLVAFVAWRSMASTEPLSSLLARGRHSGTLVVARPSDSLGLDPATVTDAESFRVTVNIYDTLFRIGSRTEPEPSLAESWTKSEDGRRWRLTLRRGVRFHDGEPLDAEAVVFNFRRWMELDHPYHRGQFQYWNLCFAGFPGMVESVSALTPRVVEIVLAEPFAPFLEILSLPAFGIASPRAIQYYDQDLARYPIGSGPFRFESWSDDGIISLRRNADYWGERAGVQRLTFKAVASPEERLRLLARGEAHILDPAPDISPTEDGVPYASVGRSLFNIGYMIFNTTRAPFDDRLARLAVAHAIDKPALVAACFGKGARVAQSFVPPVVWGHHEGLKGYEYDPELARSLSAAIFPKESRELILLATDTPRAYFPRPVAVAEFIVASLRAAGIPVRLELVPWRDMSERSRRGDYDLRLAGWNGDIPDPDNYLFTIFTPEDAEACVSSTFTFWRSPRLDDMLRSARRTDDRRLRESLYREAQSLLESELPALPLSHARTTVYVSELVSGYRPNSAGYAVLNGASLSRKGDR